MASVDTVIQDTSTMALPGLGRALVSAGKLGQKAAEDLYKKAQSGRTTFIAELTGSGAVSAYDLAHTMSTAFAAPLLDLDAIDVQRLPKDLLDAKICADFRIVVLSKRNNRLMVATADPADQQAAEKIKFATQMGVDWVIAEFDKLSKLVESQSTTANEAMDNIIGGDFEFDEMTADAAVTETSDKTLSSEVDDAPVVKFLHKMLLDAFNMRASDLHFEPYEHNYRVRFRIDGELREIASPPIAIKDKLASRIKVISRMDISEKRVPQDGRMKLKVGPDRVIDFRVSSLPTLFGEKIVIRILDPSSAKVGIDALGYEPEEKKRLMEAIGRPYGMVLVTGPTGSGKTVSLYTCLNILNKPGINISTAEDPSEINLPGVNQVNVNEKAGLTFAAALKAFLRQDPDVIMVGEIRDLETADISIKAAQTGHMVLSTLHTNDAPTTLTRMMNMGIPTFNIASSVILITAQRLARRLCPTCKAPLDVPRKALIDAGFKPEDLDGTWTPYKPVGCSACNNGYKGRVGIYQVMPISEEIQRIILKGGSALDIAQQAGREGVRTLRESGLLKVRQGMTSLEEVLSVTNE
ncbi:MAG TPA: type IV-A pilus assembly ATPase PilB [Hydrogenophaga sp.]|uniref:type IV-A pilus assembly ATPase PilB n=1 Tax=Hydrogenophaga TaxID=47420 RepID=UPI0008C02BD8|nr:MULTISPECIES: type IV-A pilus assembly ATPase PilB [Hydrogenophaga]MBU4507921.1 type IV-A pilus assembly ATPase PilB [Gammaproteobacteria bacterium]OGA74968.1 MAG: type IV-A pilus assembly ATPase PilB [Burkholderiales bacterium GWE1_65_30]OGA90992.1 MAG: type IV-A pilus assembly ATPase PilB [Burkholderiales bacterium GWF1_66_17]PKO74312.1 MAG: type IV-A pilus assembly ATPase PilB [Betaproteobacteria bacterium HGW-Betaproteobacteria-15]MDO9033147.1 type IV-A pilus assembly ATPase PilB [Hydro